LRIYFEKDFPESDGKTFDIFEQKISLFQMKDKFESLLGFSVENCKPFDTI
jgi:hypothetical protein